MSNIDNTNNSNNSCLSCGKLQTQVKDLVAKKKSYEDKILTLETENKAGIEKLSELNSTITTSKAKDFFVKSGGKVELFNDFYKANPNFDEQSKLDVLKSNGWSGFFDVDKTLSTAPEVSKTSVVGESVEAPSKPKGPTRVIN